MTMMSFPGGGMPPGFQRLFGAAQDYHPVPQPVDGTGQDRCECCDRYRKTPYSHTDSNPPYETWTYCQECYDAGCSGPHTGYCELDVDPDPILGPCHLCADGSNRPLAADGWCENHFELYRQYLETNPIPPKDRFTPVYRGERQEPAHKPAYCYPPSEWPTIDFKPEYLLNPSKAPTARKKAHIVTQQPTQSPQSGLTEADVMRLIQQANGGGGINAGPTTAVTLDEVLDSIDPRDSDSALKLFAWLKDNLRLQKVATLDQGGYLFMYQEPEGSSRQGWMAGGTQGDRIVDDALEKAAASGQKTVKGLCKHCLSTIQQAGSDSPEAETPRPGTNPTECPGNGGGRHEMAG